MSYCGSGDSKGELGSSRAKHLDNYGLRDMMRISLSEAARRTTVDFRVHETIALINRG